MTRMMFNGDNIYLSCKCGINIGIFLLFGECKGSAAIQIEGIFLGFPELLHQR